MSNFSTVRFLEKKIDLVALSYIKTGFNLIAIIVLGYSFEQEIINNYIKVLIIVQIIDSFQSSGIDYIKNKISAKSIWEELFLLRLAIGIGGIGICIPLLFFQYINFEQFLFIIISVIANSFYLSSEFLFLKYPYQALRLLIFLTSIIFSLLLVFNQYLSPYWLVVIFYLNIGYSRFRPLSFRSIDLKKRFFELSQFYKINALVICFTNIHILLMGSIFDDTKIYVLYILDRLRSIYLSILHPITKILYVRVSILGGKYSFLYFSIGVVFCLFLLIFIDDYLTILSNDNVQFQNWMYSYCILPLFVILNLFFGYLYFLHIERKNILLKSYYVGLLVYLAFLPIIFITREIAYSGVQLLAVEVIVFAYFLICFIKKDV